MSLPCLASLCVLFVCNIALLFLFFFFLPSRKVLLVCYETRCKRAPSLLLFSCNSLWFMNKCLLCVFPNFQRDMMTSIFLSAIKAHSLVTMSGSPRSKLDRLAIEENYVHSPHHAEELPADFIDDFISSSKCRWWHTLVPYIMIFQYTIYFKDNFSC